MTNSIPKWTFANSLVKPNNIEEVIGENSGVGHLFNRFSGLFITEVIFSNGFNLLSFYNYYVRLFHMYFTNKIEFV